MLSRTESGIAKIDTQKLDVKQTPEARLFPWALVSSLVGSFGISWQAVSSVVPPGAVSAPNIKALGCLLNDIEST